MVGLCEGGNEPSGSLKAIFPPLPRTSDISFAFRSLLVHPFTLRRILICAACNLLLSRSLIIHDSLPYVNTVNLQPSSTQNQDRVCSNELVSTVRSRKMFAFSSDERAFNIESYFRTDFGTIQENGQWRKRKNGELRSLYLEPYVVALVKSRRLICNKKRRTIPDKSYLGRTTRWKETFGKPRFRWNDQVQRDLKRIGRNRIVAEDREA
ncbi:hypothetical protein ANN_04794 [Periplaneta americana]|uniref:Uncharacterized protein n=1 Tax=Periplaneta americana TaxID=6978 RepID=A0ABQ8T9E7_PERAM|nr:hypothetical protein ANN_04794 [Periplaneta americana]